MKVKLPNKEIILLATAIAAIVVCITMQCISLVGISKINKEDDIACEATITTEIVANKAIYRLCECGGKVGIYDAETNIIIDIIAITTPIFIHDIKALSLTLNSSRLTSSQKFLRSFIIYSCAFFSASLPVGLVPKFLQQFLMLLIA